MEETVKKHSASFNSIDKLIVFALVLLVVVAVFINDFEIRVVCVVLCVFGISTMFLSRSSRKNEIDQRIDSNSKFENVHSIKDESISETKNGKFDNKNSNLDEHFVLVQPVFNEKQINPNKQQDKISEMRDDKLKSNQTEQNSSSQVFSDKKDIISGKDPKIEFNFFLNNILEIIKELIFAHSVLFYWVNSNNKTIVLESWITSSEKFNQKKKGAFEYSANLVGKVIEGNKTEIVTNINPDSTLDLLGYYSDKENVNSVIGMPIFYDGSLIAVLVVDSLVEDSFGNETIVQLNKFIVLLTNLIKSSTEKFEYYIDSQILKKLDHFQSLLSTTDLNTFVLEISCFFKELVEWDCATLITYDGKNFLVNQVTIKDSAKSYVSEHQVIDIYNSLVGAVIQENRFIVVSDTSELQQHRFFDHEKIHNSGSLLVMPIHSLSNTYGAMLFESNKKNYYSSQDITLLHKVCKLLSSPIEIVSLNNYINEKVMVDDTNILKPEVMLNQLSIELNRQADMDISGVLLMFSIDKHEEYISKYGVSNFIKILVSVVDIIKSSLPVYDVIGKIDDNIIAVYRLTLNLDDGKVYAEKTRKLIARNIITMFDTKSFSVTVSIGLVETYKFKSSDSMVDSCKKVLNIAIDEGGNRVKIN